VLSSYLPFGSRGWWLDFLSELADADTGGCINLHDFLELGGLVKEVPTHHSRHADTCRAYSRSRDERWRVSQIQELRAELCNELRVAGAGEPRANGMYLKAAEGPGWRSIWVKVDDPAVSIVFGPSWRLEFGNGYCYYHRDAEAARPPGPGHPRHLACCAGSR
jgi:hypothetical protein